MGPTTPSSFSPRRQGRQAKMDQTASDTIKRIVDALSQLHPQRVILFGSRATGLPDAQSDWDILIIAPSTHRPLDRRLQVRRLLGEIDRARGLDILFYTPEEAALLMQEPSSFLRHVVATGMTVYEQEAA